MEHTEEELLLLNMWEAWQDSLIASGQEGQKGKAHFIELLQAHYKEAGIKPPTDNSPMALMFLAFVGGGTTHARSF